MSDPVKPKPPVNKVAPPVNTPSKPVNKVEDPVNKVAPPQNKEALDNKISDLRERVKNNPDDTGAKIDLKKAEIEKLELGASITTKTTLWPVLQTSLFPR